MQCLGENRYYFMHYKKDWKEISGQHPWEIFRMTTKVRNEMIHFKKTFVGFGSYLPDFKLGGKMFLHFYKTEYGKIYQGHIELAQLIAQELGLSILRILVYLKEMEEMAWLIMYIVKTLI